MLNPYQYTREQLLAGVSYLVEHADGDLGQNVIGHLQSIKASLEGTGDDESARELVEDEFPIEWESPIVMIKIELTDYDIRKGGG